MSTIGQFLGGAIGYVVGGPIGAQIGLAIGGYIDPPQLPTIRGPRLTDLSAQSSAYGAHIPRIYGTVATLGNVFWVENNQLRETVTNETHSAKGGPEQSVETYSYSATFAVGLCEGPIAGVRRIWIGSSLYYDAGSDDVATIVESNKRAAGFKLYLGTETQDPDPRMQADTGVASTPAYRGLAYIVLYDYPLEKHGNTLAGAQVKAEVVGVGSVQQPMFQVASLPDTVGNRFDVSETALRAGELKPAVRTTNPATGQQRWTYQNEVLIKNWDGSLLSRQISTLNLKDGSTTIFRGCTNDPEIFAAASPQGGGLDGYWVQEGQIMPPTIRHALPREGGFFVGLYESRDAIRSEMYKTASHLYAIGGGISAPNTIQSWPLTNGKLLTGIPDRFFDVRTIPGVVINSSLYGTGAIYEDADGFIWVRGTGNWVDTNNFPVLMKFTPDLRDLLEIYRKDDGVPFLGITTDLSFTVEDGVFFYAIPAPFSNTFADVYAYDLQAGAAAYPSIRTATTTRPGRALYVAPGLIFSPNSLISTRPKLTGATVTLADVVQAEILQSELIEQSDLDVSELTDDVRGYRVSAPGAIRGALEPLIASWPFDVIQSGYGITCRRRGGSSVATIPQGDLGAYAEGDGETEPQLTLAREMDSQLPQQIRVQYFDQSREYDLNEQRAARIATDAVNQVAVELPIVLTADEAAQKAEILLYLAWLERWDPAFSLPPSYGYLEPGDVVTIDAFGGELVVRLTEITYQPDGRLSCKAKYDQAAAYTSDAKGDTGAVVGAPLVIAGPTAVQLMDIPAILPEFDRPGWAAPMTGYSAGWPGASLFQSTDEGQSYLPVASSFSRATMGNIETALPAGQPDVLDITHSARVYLLSGTLSSVTVEQALSGQNLLAIGAPGRWEIVSARDCILQSDGSYILQGLVRGQYGTAHNMALHQGGDAVVALAASTFPVIASSVDAIGLERLYRAVTVGEEIGSATDQAFTYQGVNLQPLPPVHVWAENNLNDDWRIYWTRQTRIGWEWRDFVDAQLGEVGENYEVEIYTDDTFATVARTLEVADETDTPYRYFEMQADYGSIVDTIYVRIYQLSAAVGRGRYVQATLTRPR